MPLLHTLRRESFVLPALRHHALQRCRPPLAARISPPLCRPSSTAAEPANNASTRRHRLRKAPHDLNGAQARRQFGTSARRGAAASEVRGKPKPKDPMALDSIGRTRIMQPIHGRTDFTPEPGQSVREQMVQREKSILQSIQSAIVPVVDESSGGLSPEAQTGPDPEHDEMDDFDPDYEIGGSRTLEKGDLCELRTPSGGIHVAVYLRGSRDGQRTGDFLNAQGVVMPAFPARIVWYMRNFVPEAKVEAYLEHYRKLEQYFASTGVPPKNIAGDKALTASILAPVREFYRNANVVYSQNGNKLSRLWDKFAHETEEAKLPVETAAMEVFGGNFTPVELYATHMWMMNDGLRFRVDKGFHRETQTFYLRSRRDFKMVDEVTSWVRRDTLGVTETTGSGKVLHSPVKFFIDKARGLIDLSRKVRAQKPREGKRVEALPLEKAEWTDQDRFFIDYIKERLRSVGLQTTPIEGLVPYILRSTGRYDDCELDADTAYTFLQEIGVYTPWQNHALDSARFDLPGFGNREADEEQARYDSIAGQSLEQLGLTDSLAAIRKDWGDMPVYCIDDADAHEIDDGVSVERVSDKLAWIHAHIANPSAFLPPDHWISQIAARRGTTTYFPSHVIPLLPPVVGEQVSVHRGGQVLTVSALVDENGDVKDYDVVAGKVNNVRRITYAQVSKLLGMPEATKRTLSVGGSLPEDERKNAPAKVTAKELADLKLMQELYLSLHRRRARDGATNFDVGSRSVAIHPEPALPSDKHPVLYRGHPAVEYTAVLSVPTPSSGYMIAEFMILANSIVAQYGTKHNIPLVLRACAYNEERQDTVDYWRTKIIPQRNELGDLPPIPSNIVYLLSAYATTTVIGPPGAPHVVLGLRDGYTKATSPLRRYTDMLAHWNLGAHLLHAAGASSSSSSSPAPALPFPADALERAVNQLDIHERAVRYLTRDAEKFWGAFVIKQLLAGGRAAGTARPLGRLTVVVTEMGPVWPAESRGLCVELKCAGKVAFPDAAAMSGVGLGDVVEVSLEGVKLVDRMVLFKFERVALKAGMVDEKALAERNKQLAAARALRASAAAR